MKTKGELEAITRILLNNHALWDVRIGRGYCDELYFDPTFDELERLILDALILIQDEALNSLLPSEDEIRAKANSYDPMDYMHPEEMGDDESAFYQGANWIKARLMEKK